MNNDARIAFRLPRELLDALEAAAKREMRSLSQMAVVILTRALLADTSKASEPRPRAASQRKRRAAGPRGPRRL